MEMLIWPALVLLALVLAYYRASLWAWLMAGAVAIPTVALVCRIPDLTLQITGFTFIAVAALLGIPPLRRALLMSPVLALFRRILPQVSRTEQEALDAGTVWWDGELFSGNPDWDKLLRFPRPALSEAEQAFLDNEVEQLCYMLDDWDITHVRQDLPPQVWQFIKDKGFFGMIIPKMYGGLEFSAQAHSAVVTKISSRSTTAGVTVMVPNSLGPAELLLHYGTQQQKDEYLPRLARGQEIPCFALTGPFAGSDAGSIPDTGIVCYGDFRGQRMLGIRLSWEKRYITLAPVATLLGLAFKLYDPDHLAGGESDRGITLALIPTDTPGVNIGRRHFPLNSAFLNGPTTGTDVFIPMDYVIGGVARIGEGWRMLMECLAAGRSISLPASAVGGCKLAARTSGAYARVRRQFKVPIGQFEGVEEALARIGGHLYMMDAVRKLTAIAVDLQEKPSVISAIAKYHCTELGRTVINNAMDVHGGKGICLGPNNYLGRGYQQSPISITVEGANILTRSLMIFGQGAIRAHPWVLKEMQAAHNDDKHQALLDFDVALRGHISFSLANAVRTLLFGLTGGVFIMGVPARNAHYYKKLTRYSSAFAFLSDVTMLVLGGSLKRREKISARLGDILSLLYMCSTALKRFEDDDCPREDRPLLDWAMHDALYRIEQAFDGVLQNFPNRIVALALRRMLFPFGMYRKPPSDVLGHKVVALMMQPGGPRDRLTAGMFISGDQDDAVAALESALHSTLACDALRARIAAARRSHKLKVRTGEEHSQIQEALAAGVINADEAGLLEQDIALQRKVIMVDDFAPEQLPAGK